MLERRYISQALPQHRPFRQQRRQAFVTVEVFNTHNDACSSDSEHERAAGQLRLKPDAAKVVDPGEGRDPCRQMLDQLMNGSRSSPGAAYLTASVSGRATNLPCASHCIGC